MSTTAASAVQLSRDGALYMRSIIIVHTLSLLDMYIPIRIYYRINNMKYYNFCRRQFYNTSIILLLYSHTELFKFCLVECNLQTRKFRILLKFERFG